MTTKYNAFRVYSEAQGSTIKQSLINNTAQVYVNSFEDNAGYTTIIIDGVNTGVIITNGKDSTHKFILFLPNTTIPIGEIVTIATDTTPSTTQYWLVTDFIPSLISPKASIQLCNDTLNWQTSTGFKYSVPCVATRSLLTKMDIKESSYNVSLLEGEMNVFVTADIVTETIKADQRFYLGNQIYYVGGIDDISNIGIIRFSMKTTTKSENDNDTLRICDYVGEIDFDITNPSAELLVDGTLQVTSRFTLDDNIIINPGYVITYSSSDITKAIISVNGLILAKAIGSTIITATATASGNIVLTDTFTVTISASVIDNYVVTIDGDAEISYGGSKTYTAEVTNNGNVISQACTWSILSGSTYATILSSTGTSCVISNVASGTVVLKAEFGTGTVISGTKTIVCRGMW